MNFDIPSKTLHINSRAFGDIEKGSKTLEVRRVSKFISSLTENKDIILTDKKSFLKIRISSIRRYENLSETFDKEELAQILPHITEVSEAIEYYKSLYKTDKDFSVIVLEVSVLE
jgi:ASC-1-like (ASCH) protein